MTFDTVHPNSPSHIRGIVRNASSASRSSLVKTPSANSTSSQKSPPVASFKTIQKELRDDTSSGADTYSESSSDEAKETLPSFGRKALKVNSELAIKNTNNKVDGFDDSAVAINDGPSEITTVEPMVIPFGGVQLPTIFDLDLKNNPGHDVDTVGVTRTAAGDDVNGITSSDNTLHHARISVGELLLNLTPSNCIECGQRETVLEKMFRKITELEKEAKLERAEAKKERARAGLDREQADLDREEAKEERRILNRRIVKLEEKVEKLESEVSCLKEERAVADKRINQLETGYTTLCSEFNDLSTKCKALQITYSDVTIRLRDTHESLFVQEGIIRGLHDDIEALKTANLNFMNEVNLFSNELAILRGGKDSSAFRKMLEDIETHHKSLNEDGRLVRELATLRQKVFDLEAAACTKITGGISKASEINFRDQAIKKLEEEIGQLKKELEAQEKELDSQKQELEKQKKLYEHQKILTEGWVAENRFLKDQVRRLQR